MLFFQLYANYIAALVYFDIVFCNFFYYTLEQTIALPLFLSIKCVIALHLFMLLQV